MQTSGNIINDAPNNKKKAANISDKQRTLGSILLEYFCKKGCIPERFKSSTGSVEMILPNKSEGMQHFCTVVSARCR